jgi:hypothetical protein
VYEWHGSATIRTTASAEGEHEDSSPAVLSSVQALLAESADVANETADRRIANGQLHL